MAKGLSLFERRRRRVRTALKARGGLRPRLSIHRSGRHIYAQVIDDTAGKRADKTFRGVLVVFNATPERVTQIVPGTSGQTWRLHPVQTRSSDSITRSARVSKGTFSVPARTVSVFVRR